MTVASQRELMLLQIQMTEVMTQNAQLMAKIKMRQMKRRQKAKEKAEEKRREAAEKRRKKIKKRRSVWVRRWLQRRPRLGQYTKLINELKSEDSKAFRNFLRMDYNTFSEILHRIEGRIYKRRRLIIFVNLCLLVSSIWHLASGDNYHSLMYGFRVAHNTISKVIIQVCEAIIAEYALLRLSSGKKSARCSPTD